MPKKAKKKIKYPRVIGLTFISIEATKIVIDRNEFIYHVYKNEGSLKEWVTTEKDTLRKKVVLLHDELKGSFPFLLKCKNIHAIVAFCNYAWLSNREIEVLDALQKNDGLVIQNTITPKFLHQKLSSATPYKLSTTYKWLAKGKPKVEIPKKKYSLANLIHITLAKADENLLMINPKDFWMATYSYCLNLIPEREWISQYSRLLKTAGVPKHYLKNVNSWIKNYGKTVIKRKKRTPISPLDLKMADRAAASKSVATRIK